MEEKLIDLLWEVKEGKKHPNRAYKELCVLFSVGKQSELLRCNLKNCFRKAEKHKDGYNYCDKHRPKA